MARRKPIHGRKYTFFIDYDRELLKEHPEDWIEWLRQRVLFILIDPIEVILKKRIWKKLDNKNFTMTIGIATLICCGIQAMGGFYKGKACGKEFKDFVKNYMSPAYRKDSKKLDALYRHFRCGLAHGFCIEQGGVHWDKKYFKNSKELGLLISLPRLFKDFKQAFLKYIRNLEGSDNGSSLAANFEKRFKDVFISER